MRIIWTEKMGQNWRHWRRCSNKNNLMSVTFTIIREKAYSREPYNTMEKMWKKIHHKLLKKSGIAAREVHITIMVIFMKIIFQDLRLAVLTNGLFKKECIWLLDCWTIGLSNYWVVWLLGCQTIWPSDYWVVNILGCRTTGFLRNGPTDVWGNGLADYIDDESKYITKLIWLCPIYKEPIFIYWIS